MQVQQRPTRPFQGPTQPRTVRVDHHGEPGVVTVGQFNVENWFMPGPNTDPKLRPVKNDDDKQAVVDTIHAGAPDIEALQELGGADALADLKSRLGDYPNAVFGEGNDHRGIEPGVISKFPVVKVVNHKDDTFPVAGQSEPGHFSRTLLEATVQLPNGKQLTVMSSHSKSHFAELPPEWEDHKGRVPDDVWHAGQAKSDAQRLAEAQHIHEIVEQRLKDDPNAAIVVCLDANDVPGTASINALLGSGQNGDVKLFAPLQEEGLISHPPTHRLIDVMALSPAAARMYIPGSAQGITRKGPDGAFGSDHREMEIQLDTNKA